MSSASEKDVKEAAERGRETAERRAAPAPTRGVASLVRSLTESNPRPKAKEQEVLDVATAYFLEHGYQGASINAMARSSGISKESIYRYFSSKQQLFEAVMGRELVEYRHALEHLDSILKSLDLRAALVMVVETTLALITTDRTLALRRLIFDEATRSADVGQHYYKIGPVKAYTVLQKVFETHEYESDFDVQTLSEHFVALMSWRFTLERQCAVRPEPTAEEIAEHAQAIVDDFMKAFLKTR
jgi:TetR/AcrR family transcriptional regulator, mexJK operon transcriptional repressor